MSQKKYVLNILLEAEMLGYKPTVALMDSNSKHMPTEKPLHYPMRYRQLIRMLNYLTMTRVTRPDVALSVSVVSQFMPNPRTRH